MSSLKPAPKMSPPIEKWVKHREDFHLRYRPTGKNVRDVVLWGVAFPVFVYYLTVYQQKEVDRLNGRPNTKYMG